MKALRVRIFGGEVFAIEWGHENTQPGGITGGPTHNFELAADELIEEDAGFGVPHLLA